MRIKFWVEDVENDTVLEQVGECVADSWGRAEQLYEKFAEKWADKGFAASLRSELVEEDE